MAAIDLAGSKTEMILPMKRSLFILLLYLVHEEQQLSFHAVASVGSFVGKEAQIVVLAT